MNNITDNILDNNIPDNIPDNIIENNIPDNIPDNIIENIIDINKTNFEISNIGFPLIFLFRLISLIDTLDDYSTSIILRIFLKHHTTIALTINLKKIFSDLLIKTSLSWQVLDDFYKILHKKIHLVFVLKKWNSVYNNLYFWSLNIREQNEYLLNMKEHFLSIYDCSKKGLPFHIKLQSIFKEIGSNRNAIIENIKERLIIILNIFGAKVFECLEIPLISINDFYKLTNDNLINYLTVIYDKFNELLNQTIKLFEAYNLACIQLDNLLNPIIININSLNIDSETEVDDINQLFT